jgi:hypothetical protein
MGWRREGAAMHERETLLKKRDEYLAKAEEAAKMGRNAKGDLAQQTFQKIADSWKQLAASVEAALRKNRN